MIGFKRAGIYARVSSEEQRKGWSIDDQLREARDRCAQEGWLVVGEYRDEGESAWKDKEGERPEFASLISAIEAGLVDVFVVKNLDRFARNARVALNSLHRIEAAGGDLCTLDGEVDRSSPEGRMMSLTVSGFAEYYSANLSRRVTESKRKRFERGLPNGDLPFGYGPGATTHHPPVIVDEEAEYVRELFRRYAGGTVSALELADWLNARGVEPRSKRGRGVFNADNVLIILGNAMYIGQVSYKGELAEGKHEPIIDRELFYRVQQMRGRRRKRPRAFTATEAMKRHFLLRGIARCSACGLHLRGKGWSNNSTTSYECPHRRRGTDCTAAPMARRADALEHQVGQLVRHLRVTEDFGRDAILEAAVTKRATVDLDRERARIEDRRRRIRRLYELGELVDAEYEVRLAQVRAELARVEDARLTQGASTDVSGMLLRRYAEVWDAATLDEREQIVRALFDEVWIDLSANQVVFVTPYPAFRLLFRTLDDTGLVYSGGPDRILVRRRALYKPLLEQVAGRLSFLADSSVEVA